MRQSRGIKAARELVEELAVRAFGTMTSKPEPAQGSVEIVAESTIGSSALSGQEVSTHAQAASRTSRTVHARTVEPATERASALLEVSFFRASMAQAHGPRACDVEKGSGRGDAGWRSRSGSRMGVISNEVRHCAFKIVPRSMQRVFEVGSRNSVEDGGEDIKRRHPTARIVIEAFVVCAGRSIRFVRLPRLGLRE
jgi:hypothetical protein